MLVGSLLAATAAPPSAAEIAATEAVSKVLPTTHVDLAAHMVDGQFQAGIHETHGNVDLWHDMADTVIWLPSTSRWEVPEGAANNPYLGDAGRSLWGIHTDPDVNERRGTPWLGLSSEAVVDADYQRLLTLRLDGVSGLDGGMAPGDFLMWAPSAPLPHFSTAMGLPIAYEMKPRRNGHAHAMWDFSAEGVYCVNLSLGSRLADGTPVSDRQVMTFVVGDDVDPATVPTCESQGTIPAGDHQHTPDAAPPGPKVLTRRDRSFGRLTPRVADDGSLSVGMVVHTTGANAGTAHDPDDVIAYTDGSITKTVTDATPWLGRPGEKLFVFNEASVGLAIDMAKVPRTALTGDLTLTLTSLDGPGDLVVSGSGTAYSEGRAVLSSRPGLEEPSFDLWPGTVPGREWFFTQPGVYCVGLRWAATSTLAGPVEVDKTLTFAIGDVDPHTLTPCGRGGHASPRITAQPVSAAAEIGDTATFSVATRGEQLELRWQKRDADEPAWSARWVDIPGATGTSVDVPVTSAGQSGETYRVVVSNDVGSIRSTVATLTVPRADADMTVAWPSAIHHGTGGTLDVTVAAPVTPTGTVTALEGSEVLARAKLVGGATSLALPRKLPLGTHSLTVVYAGDSDVASTTQTGVVEVVAAPAAVDLRLAKRRATTHQRVRATVRLRTVKDADNPARPLSGKVVIRDGTSVLHTVKVRPADRGRVVVRLPKLRKGKHRITARYAGTATTTADTSAPAVLRIRKARR